MTRILLHGANGAMGRALRALLDAGFADCTAGPMVSRSGNGAFASFSEVLEPADIVLDFSFHTATEGALDFALEHGLPIVIGTTGHTQQERARIERASEQIPVFFSGNMSLGIAALCGLVREAARLFPEAEIEIVETHHSRKADAPSGAYARCRRSKRAAGGSACVRPQRLFTANSQRDRHILHPPRQCDRHP